MSLRGRLPCREKCPKCGSPDISRTFRPAGKVWDERSIGKFYTPGENAFVKATQFEKTAKVDCIEHHCRTCQHGWEGPTRENMKVNAVVTKS